MAALDVGDIGDWGELAGNMPLPAPAPVEASAAGV
jgi:hypothetical protein